MKTQLLNFIDDSKELKACSQAQTTFTLGISYSVQQYLLGYFINENNLVKTQTKYIME